MTLYLGGQAPWAAAAPELLHSQAQRQRRQDAAALEAELREKIHTRPRCSDARTKSAQKIAPREAFTMALRCCQLSSHSDMVQ